jgi:hypothetical protein
LHSAKECIRGIENTNRAPALGKLFLISGAQGIFEARAFVNTVIKQLYEPGCIPSELINSNFNAPRCGDAPRTSATFQSYATALANLGNPQDDVTPIGGIAPPPRPAKRNVQMVYDLQGGDFPICHGSIHPSIEHSSTLPPLRITPMPTIVPPHPPASHKMYVRNSAMISMKKELMRMIQQEVKTQIQKEMSAMQSEVASICRQNSILYKTELKKALVMPLGNPSEPASLNKINPEKTDKHN